METPDILEIKKELLPYRCSILLADELFDLQFNHNATADLFTVDLYKDGELICAGEPIVYGVPLWRDVYKADAFPAVDIIPLDLSRESNVVTYDNLSETVLLIVDNSEEGAVAAQAETSTNAKVSKPVTPTFFRSGALVRYDHAAAGSPLNVVAAFSSAQSGSDDPSPTNIRPITGHKSVTLIRCGKNLVDMAEMEPVSSAGKVHAEHGVNTLRVYTSSPITYAGAGTKYFKIYAGVTYSLSAELVEWSGAYARVGLRTRVGGSFSGLVSLQFTEPGKKTAKFTANETTDVYLAAMATWSTSVDGSATYANIQLEVSDTATEYEPYQGDRYELSIGQTVCGGTVDAATGVLTLTHGYAELTGNERVILYQSDTHGNGATIADVLPTAEYRAGGMCSHATVQPYMNTPGGISFGNNNKYVYWIGIIAMLGLTTVDEFKDWLRAQAVAGTPVQICYELSQPQTIQLPPQTIKALQGTNILHGLVDTLEVSGQIDPAWFAEQVQAALNKAGLD